MEKNGTPITFSIKDRTYQTIDPFYPGEDKLIGEILRTRGRTMNVAGKEDGEFILSNSAGLPQELHGTPLAFPDWSPTADPDIFIFLAGPLNNSRKRRCVKHPIFSSINSRFRLVKKIG